MTLSLNRETHEYMYNRHHGNRPLRRRGGRDPVPGGAAGGAGLGGG